MIDRIIGIQAQLDVQEQNSSLPLYPLDMSSFLIVPSVISTDAQLSHSNNPMFVVQYALALWNQYCITNSETEQAQFLAQARWLIEHEIKIGDDLSGWPTSLAHASILTRGSWLSALTQGCAVSVLTRAYQLTHETTFLEVAERAVRTFLHDILDGGVQSPVGSVGLFFEEIAVYPAAHMFDGFIYAIVGLHDYILLRPSARIKVLMQCALETFQRVIDEFDTGFWTYTDLQHQRLSSSAQLFRQIHFLEVLSELTSNDFYAIVATRWKKYRLHPHSRMRYRVSSMAARCRSILMKSVRKAFLPPTPVDPPLRVSIPLNSLSTGGILTVLRGVVQVTENIWDIEYLTRYTDLNEKRYSIHLFGSAMMAPWQFPTIWIYMWDGFQKILSLTRRGNGYHLFLPQDGVFTAAFAGLAAKVTGARTVCIDHANLTLIDNDIYRKERKEALLLKSLPRRIMSAMLLKMYWPTLEAIARISAHVVDHFLVPGVVGDGVEDICKGFGIPQSRLTRFNSMINIERHIVLDESEQAVEREKNGLPVDAIVVAIICRLSPEKGLEIALESIQQALSVLGPEYKARLRVIIAGDGPSREALEEDVQRRGLSATCQFWGDISADDVIKLLAISHIFLYTSTRGACMPMAVLEAMASGCAVIATTQPLGNTVALAEGRGVIVQPGDAGETATALIDLVSDLARCRAIGQAARDYVSVQHSPMMFRRMLQRASFWSNLDDLLHVEEADSSYVESQGG